jgi:hypothetical protein
MEAAHASDLLKCTEPPIGSLLWLRASDATLRTTAAKRWGCAVSDKDLLIVEGAIGGWPPDVKSRAVEALSAARAERGLLPWVMSIGQAEARASEEAAKDAELEAARHLASVAADAEIEELLELEELVRDLSESADIPAAVHRRLLNHARRRRGDIELDAAEAAQVTSRMARSALVRRRDSWCWSCKKNVSTPRNEECRYCGWLACWFCGSCEVHRNEDGSPRSLCRATAWARPEISGAADVDSRGIPILTPCPPAADAQAIGSVFERAGVDRAFHWSPLRSAKSVLERGVLSPLELDRVGVPFVSHFYGSHEKAELLWGYAALSLYPKYQMMGSWSSSPSLFEIATDVLFTAGTLFVPGNSAASSFLAADLRGMTGLDAVNALTDGGGRLRPQSEAWIPRRIPRAAIRQVFVPNEAARDELLTWLDQRPDVGTPTVALL